MLSLRKALLNPYLLGRLVGWLWLMVDGWTTHLKNMLVKFDHFLDHFPKFRGENKNIFETPHLEQLDTEFQSSTTLPSIFLRKETGGSFNANGSTKLTLKLTPSPRCVFSPTTTPCRRVFLDFLLEDAKPHLSWVGSSPNTSREDISWLSCCLHLRHL